jgi:hypothetical protein
VRWRDVSPRGRGTAAAGAAASPGALRGIGVGACSRIGGDRGGRIRVRSRVSQRLEEAVCGGRKGASSPGVQMLAACAP